MRALVVSLVLHTAVAALLVPALAAAPGRGTFFLFAAEPWADRNGQADRRVQTAGSAALPPSRPVARIITSPDTPDVRPPVSGHATTPPVGQALPSRVAPEPLDTSLDQISAAIAAPATAPIVASVLSPESRAREVDAAISPAQSPAATRTAPDAERSMIQPFSAETTADMRREAESTLGLGLAPAGRAITITSPRDGHALTAEDIPVVVVEGEVSDPRVSRLRLVANDRRLEVPVVDRRFRHVVPVLEPLLRLRAYVGDDVDPTYASGTVTVHAPRAQGLGVVVMNWTGAGDLRTEVVASWRARSDRADHAEHVVPIDGVSLRPDAANDVFVLRSVRPGVYTLVLRYATSADVSAAPVLYLPGPRNFTARPLSPIALAGNGTIVLAKVLLPHGVLWEQDDWFSGKSESADTITKFRWPEGISWTEPKAGPK